MKCMCCGRNNHGLLGGPQPLDWQCENEVKERQRTSDLIVQLPSRGIVSGTRRLVLEPVDSGQ